VAINIHHSIGLGLPISKGILEDAQAVDPEVCVAELVNEENRIAKRGCQFLE
jgi:hypothetical protein